MRTVILVGHGSLRATSGASMIRLAARAREAGVAPIVAAGFLNYSRPPFAETLARVVARGATEVTVQPYFLVPGKFVAEDVPKLIEHGRTAHPAVRFTLAEPLGDHPALAELIMKRATLTEADGAEPAALLLVAHGSPDPAANRVVDALADRIRDSGRYAAVVVCYLGLNRPLLGAAIDDLARQGISRMVVAPYFLQLGGHVAEDLPQIIAAGRTRHPALPITLAEHLGYDPLLVNVIRDRVAVASPSET